MNGNRRGAGGERGQVRERAEVARHVGLVEVADADRRRCEIRRGLPLEDVAPAASSNARTRIAGRAGNAIRITRGAHE